MIQIGKTGVTGGPVMRMRIAVVEDEMNQYEYW